jgi:hypothetical protein
VRGRGATAILALASAAACTHQMEMERCRELFVELPVDAAAAQANLPTPYRVRLRDDGKAVVLLMVQECDRGRLDRVLPVAPLRFSQIWLQVVGPEETGAVLAGTSRSLPTASYYACPHQTDSGLAHAALTAAGIASQRVEVISLGGSPREARQGSVTERSGLAGYAWTDTSRLWPAPEYVTGRRKFDREYGSVWKRRSRGIVECRSRFLGDSEVVLRADPQSAIGRLGVGSTLRGKGHLVEMTDCRATIAIELR